MTCSGNRSTSSGVGVGIHHKRNFCERIVAATALTLLVVAASAGWIDPDTPEELRKTTSLIDESEYELVSITIPSIHWLRYV